MVDWLLAEPAGFPADRSRRRTTDGNTPPLAATSSAPAAPRTCKPFLYFTAAEDHDDQWGHLFDPAAALRCSCFSATRSAP